MCPSYHGPTGGPHWKYFGEDTRTIEAKLFGEVLRFFDRYLKGVDNGIDREDPICIYAMHGGGWRTEKEWPLARTRAQRLFFDSNKSLSTSKPIGGKDEYVPDLTHSSTYTRTNGNRWVGIGGRWPESPPMRTYKDKNRPLLDTGDPLQKLKDLSAERDPLYRETADLVVSTEGRSASAVVEDIVNYIETA